MRPTALAALARGLVGQARATTGDAAHACRTASGAAAGPPPSVGHELTTTRTFTQADVAAFTRLTGDANPLHHSSAAAPASPPVPGLLTASLFPALVGSAWPGAVYAKQALKFAAPLGVGEAVAAAVRVERVRVREGARRTDGAAPPPTAVVTFSTVARRAGGGGGVVVEGEAVAVLPVVLKTR